MSLLAERLRKLRWMAVPIAVYLVVTLALPAANGAVLHGAFLRHAGWVVAGCAAILALATLGGVAATLAGRAAHRVVNRRRSRGVVSTGGQP